MFFDIILLQGQRGARFPLAWVAATRGVQHVSKKNIIEIDIVKLCDEIASYICSQSDVPRSRFSLRLSALLINGTIRIYRQKATYVIESWVKFTMSVAKLDAHILPPKDKEIVIPKAPFPIPKKKIIRNRPSVEQSTPQSQLDKLVASIMAREIEPIELHEEQAVLQARADEITLHETQLPREAPLEEFGALGGLLTEGELLQEIPEIEKEILPPQPPLQPIEEVPEPFIPGITSLRVSAETPIMPRVLSSSSPETQPALTFIVEAQVHVSAGQEMQTPPEIRRRKRERRAAARPSEIITEVEVVRPTVVEEIVGEQLAEVIEQRPVLQELPARAVEKRDKRVPIKKGKADDWAKLLISTKPTTRVVRINRCEADEVDWVNINPCPLPEFKLRDPNLTNLLNLYVTRDERYLDLELDRRPRAEPSSLEASVILRKKSGVETPPPDISEKEQTARPTMIEQIEEQEAILPEVLVTAPEPTRITETRLEVTGPMVTSTPMRRMTPEIEQRTIEEVMAVAAEEEARSPRKRRRLIDVEPELAVKDLDFITLPSELPSRDLTVSVPTIQPETVDSVPRPILTEQGRQQEIVNKISISGQSTLEQLCQRPVNKLNIARAFSDVLVLCRYGYVSLVSEDDSSELKFIERGPKMTR